MSDPHQPPAGLTYAPPYDQSQELDPHRVKPVLIPSGDLSKLAYFQEQHLKRTRVMRALLLVVIFGMLAANAWLTQRNHTALLINMNQARLEQAQVMDDNSRQVAALSAKIDQLQADLAALKAQKDATVANR